MASISSNPGTDAVPTRTWWSPSSPSTPDNEIENATLWSWNRIAAAETSISDQVPTLESPVPVFDSIPFALRPWASISQDSKFVGFEYRIRGSRSPGNGRTGALGRRTHIGTLEELKESEAKEQKPTEKVRRRSREK
jgi:hypothetical protein